MSNRIGSFLHRSKSDDPVDAEGAGNDSPGGAAGDAGEKHAAAAPGIIPDPASAYAAASDGDERSPVPETDFEPYETYFGMREPPFTLTPNPAFFFVNERSREGLKQIEYGIRRREGFAVISGDVGTGKTTLCWALLERLEKMNVRTALVQNPMVSATDVLKLILHDLGVGPQAIEGEPVDPSHLFDTSWMAGMGQMELIERLNTFLIQMARKGLFTVVIIDEAQRLSMETLEQLRLLSNLETASQKLLQIIFVGQAELEQMLEKPALRQLNQRISVRFATKPLDRKETGEYIRHRLRIAWAIPRLQFKKRAFDTIYRLSGGYPRLINMICDRALSLAFQQESYLVTPKMVRSSFRYIKEIHPGRHSVWIRRSAAIAGVLALVLLIIFLLVSKNVIPSTESVFSTIPVSRGPAIAATTSAVPPKAERPPAAPAIAAATQGPPAAAVPKPIAAARKTVSAARGHEYILQTSSFRDAGGAKAASEELEARGIPSFFERYPDGPGGDWYRVYAGPYNNLSEAKRAASKLKAALGKRPLLRQRTAQ